MVRVHRIMKEIAVTLRMSPHTVQQHVRHFFDKLGINSRRALASLLGGLHGSPGPAAPSG
jgi:DNA-binding CsgD family transcriptional regulator